jgi:hypothetical protein
VRAVAIAKRSKSKNERCRPGGSRTARGKRGWEP